MALPIRGPKGRFMKAPRKSWLAITLEVLASRAVTIVGTAAIMFVAFAAIYPDRHAVGITDPMAAPRYHSMRAAPVLRAPVAALQWPATVTCFVGYKRTPC